MFSFSPLWGPKLRLCVVVTPFRIKAPRMIRLLVLSASLFHHSPLFYQQQRAPSKKLRILRNLRRRALTQTLQNLSPSLMWTLTVTINISPNKLTLVLMQTKSDREKELLSLSHGKQSHQLQMVRRSLLLDRLDLVRLRNNSSNES